MKELIEKFKAEFPYLKIEEKLEEYLLFDEEETVRETQYLFSNFNGNKNITILITEEQEANDLYTSLKNDITILDDFLGLKYQDKYEIVLAAVSRNILFNPLRGKKIEATINYFKNELKITIDNSQENKPSLFFYKNLSRIQSNRRLVTFTIENFKRSSPEGYNNDLRNILNSVLFDIEYNYNIPFEAIELSSLNRRIPKIKRPGFSLTEANKLQLVFRKYIPELIQYAHLAEKVDYIPFKYLCFYHIIEYFSDRSAYFVVNEQIKQILLKPDFHLKTNHYVNQAVNFFKKENDKHLTDKIKLSRVLQQFVSSLEFKEYLNDIKLLDHFQKEQTFNCNVELKLPALDFTNDQTFYQTLTNRIYSIRCSIVHSNPDFDETKAVPFVNSAENVFRLNIETALVYEVSRNIIVKSAETR